MDGKVYSSITISSNPFFIPSIASYFGIFPELSPALANTVLAEALLVLTKPCMKVIDAVLLQLFPESKI